MKNDSLLIAACLSAIFLTACGGGEPRPPESTIAQPILATSPAPAVATSPTPVVASGSSAQQPETPVSAAFISSVLMTEVPASPRVAFEGRWFVDEIKGERVARSITQGASFSFEIVGAVSVNLSVVVPDGQKYAPRLAVFVGNAQAPNYVDVGVDGNENASKKVSINIATNLDPAALTQIKVVIDGLYLDDPLWEGSAGLLVSDITANSGEIKALPSNKPKATFIGDSITAGIGCRPSVFIGRPKDNCGASTYGMIASKILGFSSDMAGYGGTGLTTGGPGKVPATLLNYTNFANGRHYNLASDYYFINLGTNDIGPNYQPRLETLLRELLALNPKYIFVVEPFNSQVPGFANHLPEIKLAIAALNSSKISVIETGGWLTADDVVGLHPTIAGHKKAGEKLAEFGRARGL